MTRYPSHRPCWSLWLDVRACLAGYPSLVARRIVTGIDAALWDGGDAKWLRLALSFVRACRDLHPLAYRSAKRIEAT